MQTDIPVATPIEDVQARPDNRNLAIDQVGIKDIRHPLQVLGRDGAVQHTVATSTLTVALPHHVKGTHMSRFVAILEEQDEPVTSGGFRAMLRNMTALLEAEAGRITMRFPYFVRKAAPVSGVQSLLDYQVSLDGRIRNGRTEARLEVVVPVTSLCPCSRSISDYGAHNQRSHVTVSAETGDSVFPEDLIALVEAEASCEIYGLLKRPDEKHVTERAYDNPKFVEDIVRDVAARLNAHPDIHRYRVETENFESIHNHSAYAMIEGGIDPGHRP